jgi:hypothetical protein
MKTTKTYNVETPGTPGIEVIKAYTCQVTPSGCLVFINTNDRVCYGFRDGQWVRFWIVEDE